MNRVDQGRLDKLVAAARSSARLRMNDNLHGMDDAIHRLLNATEPSTYVQPHRHAAPPKVETMAVLRGRGAIVLFDDEGRVIEEVVLAVGGPVVVAEVPAGAWHTLIALEPGTVWFEVKAGPYAPLRPEEIAAFAPAPASPGAAQYLERLEARFR